MIQSKYGWYQKRLYIFSPDSELGLVLRFQDTVEGERGTVAVAVVQIAFLVAFAREALEVVAAADAAAEQRSGPVPGALAFESAGPSSFWADPSDAERSGSPFACAAFVADLDSES